VGSNPTPSALRFIRTRDRLRITVDPDPRSGSVVTWVDVVSWFVGAIALIGGIVFAFWYLSRNNWDLSAVFSRRKRRAFWRSRR
jgi:hypothetical protein